MNFNLAHAAIQYERWLANQRTHKLLMSENFTKDIGKLKRFMQDKDYFFNKEAFDLILKDFQNEIND